MKLLSILFPAFLLSSSAFGQTCGIYRIRYCGTITSDSLQVESVLLPAIESLGTGKKRSPSEKTAVVNGAYTLEIRSPLTTPPSNVNDLRSLCEEGGEYLTMNIVYTKGHEMQVITVGIPWTAITLTPVNDGKVGALFECRIQAIAL